MEHSELRLDNIVLGQLGYMGKHNIQHCAVWCNFGLSRSEYGRKEDWRPLRNG
jgi:hypothetical protein